MSFNIKHGQGMDGVIDLERTAEVIRREEVDIVALQEVDVGVERSGERDIARELAELTGLEHYAFGKNVEVEGGDYGTATLSRFPIVEEQNTHLTQLGPEQRGVLQTVIEVEGEELLFLNTHLDHRGEDDAERLQSIREVDEEILPEYEGVDAVVFAGDFNDVPGSSTHQKMTELMTDAWEEAGEGEGLTIPPDEPERRIDYIFYDGGVAPAKVWVPQTLTSDHLPVVAEFFFQQ